MRSENIWGFLENIMTPAIRKAFTSRLGLSWKRTNFLQDNTTWAKTVQIVPVICKYYVIV